MRSLNIALAILVVLQATASHAQEAIGKAKSVIPQAEGSHVGPLSGGSSVYSKETVRTGDTGQADLQFHDSSNLTVGPKSSSGSISSCTTRTNQRVPLRSRRHAARFVSLQDHRARGPSRTPYGTLGVRG